MFYDNLKKICEEKNLKMTPILKECGIATGSISNWKKGIYPNSEIILKLSTHLNVSTDLLLKGTEDTKLTQDEKYVLSIYNQLTEKNKAKAEGYIEERLKEQKSQNKEQSYTA